MTKKILIAICLFAYFFSTQANTIKIGQITDLHYMAPELLVVKGSAFDNYVKRDRKLLYDSPAILRAAVQNLLDEKVDIVLVSGDLTKDGELLSHEGVAKTLQSLLDHGVKVLVIPGNHDINNPFALSFHGDTTSAAATVTADDFRQIYENFGFGSAISKDLNSLSYVSEPVPGLRILCLDGIKYYNNTFISNGASADTRITKGVIKPETMAWIKSEIAQAKAQGKQLVGMVLKSLSTSGTELLLANFKGNENLADSSVLKRKEFIKDMDELIGDFARKSSGVLAPITSEVFKRTDMFRKLKDASRSIWDNRVEKSYRGRDYKFQLHEPINDLNLVIDLGELR